MPWTSDALAERSLKTAVLNGVRCRCPRCGEGKLFKGYINVVDRCEVCGLDLTPQRADDAPPYIVIFIVGHLVVALGLLVERNYAPPMWVHMALWIPFIVIVSLLLLPPVKGAIVGLQWANRMHGFGEAESVS